jgi:hypothetical protein
MVSGMASGSDPWRLGVLFSRSGLTAVTETGHFLGTALAIQEINQAGGILGRKLEVMAYDPQSDPVTYRRLADRLFDRGRHFRDIRLQFIGPAQGRSAGDRAPQRAIVVSIALRGLRILPQRHLYRGLAEPEQLAFWDDCFDECFPEF